MIFHFNETKANVKTFLLQGTYDREGDFNIYSIYSKSKASLRNFLDTPGVINKDSFTLLAGTHTLFAE